MERGRDTINDVFCRFLMLSTYHFLNNFAIKRKIVTFCQVLVFYDLNIFYCMIFLQKDQGQVLKTQNAFFCILFTSVNKQSLNKICSVSNSFYSNCVYFDKTVDLLQSHSGCLQVHWNGIISRHIDSSQSRRDICKHYSP